jgi:hypothetical protein
MAVSGVSIPLTKFNGKTVDRTQLIAVDSILFATTDPVSGTILWTNGTTTADTYVTSLSLTALKAAIEATGYTENRIQLVAVYEKGSAKYEGGRNFLLNIDKVESAADLLTADNIPTARTIIKYKLNDKGSTVKLVTEDIIVGNSPYV